MTYITPLWLGQRYKANWPILPACKRLHSIWTQEILHTTVNSSPTPALFAACVDGDFHEFPWVRDYFMAFESIWVCYTPLIYHIWETMGIRKVKTDQLTFFACLPCTLSLVSNLEEETSRICVELYGNISFIYLIRN